MCPYCGEFCWAMIGLASHLQIHIKWIIYNSPYWLYNGNRLQSNLMFMLQFPTFIHPILWPLLLIIPLSVPSCVSLNEVFMIWQEHLPRQRRGGEREEGDWLVVHKGRAVRMEAERRRMGLWIDLTTNNHPRVFVVLLTMLVFSNRFVAQCSAISTQVETLLVASLSVNILVCERQGPILSCQVCQSMIVRVGSWC